MSSAYVPAIQHLLELKRPHLIIEEVLKPLDRPNRRTEFFVEYVRYLNHPELKHVRRGRTAEEAALENLALWLGFADPSFSALWYRSVPELSGKHPFEQGIVAA